ncbi:hypothetical protein C8R46DRAFT_1076541 [Mycena filopes]|nr:hypothetical protein C8R46DRAFT_1076541 [Mycena filopes]
MSLRYIRHNNHPPADLDASYRDILNALGTEVRRVESNAPKSRKTGSVYVGLAGSALMTHHLSTATAQQDVPLLGLSPTELLAFTDARLAQTLNLSPTSLSSPSSGSHSSFLETAVGIATLILIRALEQVTLTGTVSDSPFCDNWGSCAQLLTSAASMAISEDPHREADEEDGCEVLYGRAGLLYALLRLRSASKQSDIKPSDLNSVELVTTVREISSKARLQLLVESIIQRGKSGAASHAAQLAGVDLPSPSLMWTWHGKRYLGAAHGVAGILHILLLCPADIIGSHMDSILHTVEWLIGCQDPQGNWPTAAPLDFTEYRSGHGKELVQWCHGAPGIILLLCTVLRCATSNSAAPLLDKVVASMQAAAGLVYRHGLLSKGVGLCHGVAGSVFALLAVSDVLDRVHTQKIKPATTPSEEEAYYLIRATHLAQLAVGHEALTARGDMSVPDYPWSLYGGLAGMCCAWAEVLRRLAGLKRGLRCDRSGMPGFDDAVGDTWASW